MPPKKVLSPGRAYLSRLELPPSPATYITAVEICLVKPTNQAELTMSLPLASVTPLVPVLPATGRLRVWTERPVPFSTTLDRAKVTSRAMSALTTRSLAGFAS